MSTSDDGEFVVSADDEATAMEIALAQQTDVVVDSLTTQTEQVVAQPDGSFELTISSVPVRVLQEDGWVAVDPTLSLDSSGFLAPVATTVPVQFSNGGSTELARVQGPDGQWLVETWPLGDLPTPTVDGSSATYADVLPGVDLRLVATATGMSEVLIVEDEEAATNPDLATLEIGVEGGTVTQQSNGLLSVDAEGGTPGVHDEGELRSSAPTLWDSSEEDAGAGGPGVDDDVVAIDTSVIEDTVVLDVGGTVELSDLTYPIFVDPDWTGNRVHSWYVDSAYPNQSYLDGTGYADGMNAVGYINGSYSSDGLSHTARAFWEMNTSSVAGKTIIAAHLNTTEVWSFNCTPSGVQLWWTGTAGAGATWNGSTGIGWIQKLDEKSIAYGWGPGCPAQAVGFNALAGVQAAASVNASSLALALRATDEGSSGSWKKFAYDATLTITYNTKPGTPTSLSMTSPVRACSTSASSPSYINGTQATTLQATFPDADGGNTVGRFYVQSMAVPSAPVNALSSAYLSTASQAQGSPKSVQIPADTLDPGAYQWYAVGYDGTATGATSAKCQFVVKNTPPAAPTIQARGSAPYTVGVATTIQLKSTAADQVSVFGLWWSYSSSVTAPTVPVLTAIPGCSIGSGATRYICPDSTGLSPVITVAPVAEQAVLWVVSYDAVGNPSPAKAVPYTSTLYAQPDEVNVSFDAGHGWLPDSPVATGGVLTDINSSVPKSITLRNGSGVVSTNEIDDTMPVLDFPGYLALSEYTVGDSLVEIVGGTAGSGYVFANKVGWILPQLLSGQSQPTGTNPLYRCAPGVDDYLSLTSCGAAGGGIIGYTWATSAAVPAGLSKALLRECVAAGDRYVSTAACPAGETTGPSLGYVSTGSATQASSALLNTTQKFTVSAWLKPTALTSTARPMTALSQSNGYGYAFALGVSSAGNWQFCMRSMVDGAKVCATGTAAAANTWQYVTGVWDPANQQLRLFLGDTSTPSAVAWRKLPSGDTSASGSFTVGSAVYGNANTDSWRGQIMYPTVFQGIANKLQRHNLYLGHYPFPY